MSRYMQSEIERLAAAVETLEAKLERAEGQVRAMREDASRALGNAVRERDEAWVAAGTARAEGWAAADSWWRSRLESDEAHVVVHQAILEAANRGDHITTQAVEVLRALRASLLPVNEPETATPIPDSEFVEPPLMPPDPISERMIDVADDAFRHGSSDEQAWRECLGDALHAVYPLIRERVIAEASQGKRPANPKPETDT